MDSKGPDKPEGQKGSHLVKKEKEKEKEKERRDIAILRLCHVRIATLHLIGPKIAEMDGAEPVLAISSAARQRKVLSSLPLPALSNPPSDGMIPVDSTVSFQYQHSLKLPDAGANELRFSLCLMKGKRQVATLGVATVDMNAILQCPLDGKLQMYSSPAIAAAVERAEKPVSAGGKAIQKMMEAGIGGAIASKIEGKKGEGDVKKKGPVEKARADQREKETRKVGTPELIELRDTRENSSGDFNLAAGTDGESAEKAERLVAVLQVTLTSYPVEVEFEEAQQWEGLLDGEDSSDVSEETSEVEDKEQLGEGVNLEEQKDVRPLAERVHESFQEKEREKERLVGKEKEGETKLDKEKSKRFRNKFKMPVARKQETIVERAEDNSSQTTPVSPVEVENEEPPPLVETGRRETGGDLSEWNFDMDASAMEKIQRGKEWEVEDETLGELTDEEGDLMQADLRDVGVSEKRDKDRKEKEKKKEKKEKAKADPFEESGGEEANATGVSDLTSSVTLFIDCTLQSGQKLLNLVKKSPALRDITACRASDVNDVDTKLVSLVKEQESPLAVRVAIAGGDGLINHILRKFVRELAKIPKDMSKYRFYIIPLGPPSSCQLSRDIAARDSTYKGLFTEHLWMELANSTTVSLTYSKSEEKIVTKALQHYLEGGRESIDFPIAEAFITFSDVVQTENEQKSLKIPFVKGVQIGLSNKGTVEPSALLDSGGEADVVDLHLDYWKLKKGSSGTPVQSSLKASFSFVSVTPLSSETPQRAVTQSAHKGSEKDKKGILESDDRPSFRMELHYQKDKKQIVRIPGMRGGQGGPEKNMSLSATITQMICSAPDNASRLHVVVDSTEYTGVRFVKLLPSWRSRIQGFPIAHFSS